MSTENLSNSEEKQEIRVSARAMAEAVYVGGDLFAAGDLALLQDAAEAHRREQRRQRAEAYRAEVTVETTVESAHFRCRVTGRIDGLIEGEAGVTVQEIKTVASGAPGVPETANPAYWAQAVAYGHMLCQTRGLSGLTVQLLYLGRGDGSRQAYDHPMTAAQLRDAFLQTASAYLDQVERDYARQEAFRRSARALAFPYPSYRQGQREMMRYAYLAAVEGRRVFVQAPTGIGKTAAALYPAVQALCQGAVNRVFYLTAQGTNAAAALDFMRMLEKEGLKTCVCRLCAKDELCPLPVRDCSDACPYAQGYFDRAPQAVQDLLDLGGVLDAPQIREAAVRARVCPHELALDLSLGCPVTVCDFNYAFDPRVRLRRYFTQGGEYQLLVDEAHALPDRARAMYSAAVDAAAFAALRKALGRACRASALYQKTSAVLRAFAALETDPAFVRGRPLDEPPQEPPRLVAAVAPEALLEALAGWLEAAQGDLAAAAPLRELYQTVWHFLAQAQDAQGPRWQYLLTRGKTGARAELLCLDAAPDLRRTLDKCRSALFFSATLSPIGAYKRLCGGQEQDAHALLPSPYAPENLAVFRLRLDVSYSNRAAALEEISAALEAMVRARPGHYMAFFPSYAYLSQGYAHFAQRCPDIPARCTGPGEAPQERAALVEAFKQETDKPLLVFAVLGGVFAQSVDLPGDALLGCAAVTVGLPRLEPRTRLLKEYFDQNGENGFDAALRIPAMGRVAQAGGRVVRAGTDRGVVVLIDRRFAQSAYAALLPSHWQVRPAADACALRGLLDAFWARQGQED